MGRILGIDFGKRRIGLALSDPLGMFASGLTTLDNRSEKAAIKALIEVIQAHQVEHLVFGLPLRHTGEEGDSAEAVKQFASLVESATQIPITFEDERFTSVIAQQSLREQGVQPSRQKHLVDQTSAALILQQYLDKQARLKT